MSELVTPRQRAPFKFLDPYGPKDRDIFFGRDLEIAEVYARFYRSRTLVVHGESGSGKTSLVQCGLRAKIPSYDALFITVRAVLDPLEALRRELLRELAPYIEPNIEPVAAPESIHACIERLANATRKTVVLVFDQFEEFFRFQPAPVRERFIREFAAWSEAELNARCVICIREENLARLTEFEAAAPDIFWNRLWVRRMSGDQARQAITGPCAACGITAAPELVDELLADLTRGGKGVELPILQVVLDSLYHTELAKKAAVSATDEKDAPLVLSLEAYKAQGKIEAILARFVENAVANHPTPDAARQVLKSLVTSEGTKKVSGLREIEEAVLQFGEPIPTTELETLLRDLINTRVLREDAENHLFELRHDALAATIHDWMTGLEKELMEAREALRGRFRHHEALRKSGGALLDQAFLVYLAPYEPRLKLTGELAAYVAASQDQAKKRLRRRRIVLGGLVALAFLVLAGFTMWNVKERNEAKRQEVNAREQEGIAKKQEARAREQEGIAKENEDKTKRTMAEIIRGDGRRAQMGNDIGKSLLLYAKSLSLHDSFAARVCAAEALAKNEWFEQTVFRYQNIVRSVAFSPDGQTIASGDGGFSIHLWDRSSGKLLAVWEDDWKVFSVAFSPDGQTIASGSNQTIRLWDRASGKKMAVLSGHGDDVNSVAFSPDGKTVASGSGDNTIRLWNSASGKVLTVLRGHEDAVNSVAFSPDGKTVASGSDDGTIRLWDRASSKVLTVLRRHESSISSVAFSPDGKTVASGSYDTIRLWNLGSGEVLAELSGHESTVHSVAFSPDGQTIASASGRERNAPFDTTIRLWGRASSKEQTVLKGHEKEVQSVAFSPDSKMLISRSEDKTIRLWDRSSGKELAVLREGSSHMAISPDGQVIVMGADDKTIRLWDRTSDKELAVLRGGSFPIAFSPDGERIASGALDNTILIWDRASANLLVKLSGDEKGIESLVFSPDNKTLASRFDGGIILLWDLASGKLLVALEGGGRSSIITCPSALTARPSS